MLVVGHMPRDLRPDRDWRMFQDFTAQDEGKADDVVAPLKGIVGISNSFEACFTASCRNTGVVACSMLSMGSGT